MPDATGVETLSTRAEVGAERPPNVGDWVGITGVEIVRAGGTIDIPAKEPTDDEPPATVDAPAPDDAPGPEEPATDDDAPTGSSTSVEDGRRLADETEAENVGDAMETLALALADACTVTAAEALTAIGAAGVVMLAGRTVELDGVDVRTIEGIVICLFSRAGADGNWTRVSRPMSVLGKIDANTLVGLGTDGTSIHLSTTPSLVAAHAIIPLAVNGMI